VTTDITVPSVPDDAYQFIVVTDADDAVFEGDPTSLEENNNTRVSTTELLVAHPDLQPVLTAVPVDPVSGTEIEFSYRVDNAGTSSANGSWVDRVYLSDDTTLDASDVLLATLNQVGPVAPASFYEATATATLPIDAKGPKFIIVVVDADNDIDEVGDEDNNDATSPVNVVLAPFADLDD